MRMVICLQIPTTFFFQLLNAHRVSDVRKTEIHTAEPLVFDPSPFEVEITIATMKRYISPGCEIKFWQNLFKQEVKHYGLKSISPLILFGRRTA
jgi:hypothetical protein